MDSVLRTLNTVMIKKLVVLIIFHINVQMVFVLLMMMNVLLNLSVLMKLIVLMVLVLLLLIYVL